TGAGCAAIALATTPTYTVVEADAGNTMRVSLTASNAVGSSAPATSSQTAVVTWQVPSNTSLPTISGYAQAGQTLSASTGTWSGAPTSYGYQWQRCDAGGGGCTAIASATASSYAAVEPDVGRTLRVLVTASNPAGQHSATSAATKAVGQAQQPP